MWTAAFFINKARLVGTSTEAVIQNILKCRKYEVQTYRMCLGVLNFGGKYGKPVLEECCRRAIDCGKTTYTFIKTPFPQLRMRWEQKSENAALPLKKRADTR